MAGFSNNFGREIAKYAQRTGKRIEQVVRAVAVQTLSGIVKDTPVDTGRLRGNWQTSAGTPIYTQIDREDKNGATVIKEIVDNVNPRGVTYMTNNLPYAKRRNDEGGARYMVERKNGIRQPRPENVPAISAGTGVNAGFVEKNMARIERNLKEAVSGAKD
jgi:hypothetical protein